MLCKSLILANKISLNLEVFEQNFSFFSFCVCVKYFFVILIYI